MSELATKLEADDLRPGTHLLGGRLVIDQRIGRGGMSTVYAATDRGRVVAVKIIASVYARDPDACQRFRNEARLTQALADHPRVVTPYEVGELPELDGRPYMTMPLVRGTPLGMVADRKDWRRWVAVIADVSRTVADLHIRGIIHRDIKPGNVILRTDHGQDVPYLLDFGSAYSKGDGHVPATAGLTRSDECPGTKLYMAPEQALGHPAAPSFDVYALGLSLYELLAGTHPLAGMSPAEAVRRKCNRELPSLSLRDHRPELPEAVLDAVDRALEREPERRTGTADALARELEAALGAGRVGVEMAVEQAPTATAPEVSAPSVVSSRRAKRAPALWLGLASALVVTIVVGAAWPGDTGTSPRDLAVVPESTDDGGAPVGDAEAMETSDGTTSMLEEGSEADGAASDAGAGSTTGLGEAESPAPEAPTAKVRPPHRDPKSAECVAARGTAQDAAVRRDWDAVLKATKRSKCWPREDLRRTLRVQAFHALGDYRACVKAAGKASDTSTRRTARLCELALTHEGPASP